MKILPVTYTQYNINFSGHGSKNQCSRQQQAVDVNQYLSKLKENETMTQKIMRKVMVKVNPRKAAAKELNAVVEFRNKMLPDNPINMIFCTDCLPQHDCEKFAYYLKKILYMPDNKRQLSDEDLSFICSYGITAGAMARIVNEELFKDMEKRSRPLSVNEIVKIGEWPRENIQLIKKYNLLDDIEGREEQLGFFDLQAFINTVQKHNNYLNKNTFPNIKKRKLFTSKFDSEDYLNMKKVLMLANLPDAEWQNLKQKKILKYHKQLNEDAIRLLIKTGQDKAGIIKYFLDTKAVNYIGKEGINELLSFSDEKLQKAKKFIDNKYEFQDIKTLAYFTDYDDDVIENYKKAMDAAYEKKELLFTDGENLDDDDINLNIPSMFDSFSTRIHEMIDTLGLKTFVHCYSEGYEHLEDLLTGVILSGNEKKDYTLSQRMEIKRRLSDKSISPEDKILRYKTIMSAPGLDNKNKLIAAIRPNTPTKKQMEDAKEIWVQTEKSFDEKLAEFNGRFKTEGNKRVQLFFESRAYLCSDGHKSLTAVNSKELAQLIANEVNRKNNNILWNDAVNDIIFLHLKEPRSKELSEKVDLTKSRYISNILSAEGQSFKNIMKLLAIINDEPHLTIKDTLNNLPQNAATKHEFERFKLDYDKWVTPDKNLSVPISVQLDRKKAEYKVLQSINEDFDILNQAEFPKEEIDKIYNALKKTGVGQQSEKVFEMSEDNGFSQKEQKKLSRDGRKLEITDIPDIIDTVKMVVTSEKFWQKPIEDDETLRSARDNFLFHITQMRPKEVENIAKMPLKSKNNLIVRQTDMNDVAHSLFLGNHAGCCTAIGSSRGNDFAAARYIMDKFISAIEVADKDKCVGNTMCYFVNINGKAALVLDNIELVGKYQNIDEIRDAIIKMAELICKNVGVPDAHIYAGPFRHKVSMNNYTVKQCEMNILGDTNDHSTYLDFTGTTKVRPEIVFKTPMYKIK